MFSSTSPGFYDNAPRALIELLAPQPGAPVPPSLELLWPEALPPICDALGEIEIPILFIRGELTPEPIQASLDAYQARLLVHESAKIPESAHTLSSTTPRRLTKFCWDS